MTAICKTIPVYNKHHLGQLNQYGADEIKTSLIANQLENTLEYAANPEKTLAAIALNSDEKELLVSGVRCTYETAVDEFADTRDKYIAWHGTEGYSAFDFLDKRTGEIREVTKKPLTALHLIQSFSEPERYVIHRLRFFNSTRLCIKSFLSWLSKYR